MLKNKYIKKREVLDDKIRYNGENIVAIRLPKEAILQFFRKRFYGSKEKWYKMVMSSEHIKPDAIILDYIADEESNDIWLILEHKSYPLTDEDNCIPTIRVYLEK